MRTRVVTLRRGRSSTTSPLSGASPVGAVVALLVAVLCAVVGAVVMSSASISVMGILVAVLAVVVGLLALSVSALMFATGFHPNTVQQ